MSIRQYRPRSIAGRSGTRSRDLFLILLTIASIGLQITYPLVHNKLLQEITIATVYCAAVTMLIHSYFAYGFRFALTMGIVVLIFAFTVEAIGVKTGWPFGKYSYDHSLGKQIFGVPILVPFAWVMLTYPLLIAARRVTKNWVFIYGGIGLAAWDLFLDPQMVSAGRWTWKVVGPHVPYAPEIPLSNTAGWLFAGMGLMALLHAWLPKDRRKGGATTSIPDFFLAWTLFAGLIGNVFFFHRPGVGVFGAIVFGAVLIPYFFSIGFGRPANL
jgi:putative membrane protein